MTPRSILELLDPEELGDHPIVTCDSCGDAVPHADQEFYAVDGVGHLDCVETCDVCHAQTLRGTYIDATDMLLCVPCQRVYKSVAA